MRNNAMQHAGGGIHTNAGNNPYISLSPRNSLDSQKKQTTKFHNMINGVREKQHSMRTNY
jgi:hypothetical protein